MSRRNFFKKTLKNRTYPKLLTGSVYAHTHTHTHTHTYIYCIWHVSFHSALTHSFVLTLCFVLFTLSCLTFSFVFHAFMSDRQACLCSGTERTISPLCAGAAGGGENEVGRGRTERVGGVYTKKPWQLITAGEAILPSPFTTTSCSLKVALH